jgi:DNA (cytosine-5)-methyltransferase 1
MSRQLLIKGLPEDVHDWIAETAHRERVPKKDVVLAALLAAQKGTGTLSLFDRPPQPTVDPESAPFKFVDLFAGIGGLRIGLESAGGRCVFSSEWDKHSQKTYKKWFGEMPKGDVTKIPISEIPDHDVLAAGFPCQPFSIAGVSKKKSLGRAHGFKDQTQGTLFFHLATIIELKRPPVIFLENVKNLRSHDKGKTWKVIKSTLEGLEYTIFTQVVDAAGWVPQHRERIFIIGFDKHIFGEHVEFKFPTPPSGEPPKFRSILEPKPDPKYTLTDHLWKYLQKYAAKHAKAGNGFGYGLADLDGVSRTISARYYKDGSEILIPQRDKNPRRLTNREAAKLMGFDPDKYEIVVSDTQAYRQFGNAVVPPVAAAVAREIVRSISNHVFQDGNGCLLKGRFGSLPQTPAVQSA